MSEMQRMKDQLNNILKIQKERDIALIEASLLQVAIKSAAERIQAMESLGRF